MTLALAHPALLWTGLGLVAVPILIHFFFRRKHRVVRWAAMDFLLAALRKQKRRLQMENLLLLLLRCALVLLLGLALARPAVRAAALAPFSGGARNVIVVVDTSASMGAHHTGLRAIDRARDRAATLLGRLSESSNVTLIATCDDGSGGGPRAPIENARPSEVRQKLGALRTGHGPNRLGDVLRLAREKLEGARGGSAIVFLSDLQRRDWRDDSGARREDVARALRELRRERDQEAPPVVLLDVGAEENGNVAIASFSKEPGREAFAGSLCGLSARLVNYGPAPAEGTLSLFVARDDGTWERKSATPVRLRPSLEAGAPSTETPELFLPLPKGSEGPARFKVVFEGGASGADRFPDDSERFLALRVRPPVRFLPVRSWRGALEIVSDVEALDVIDMAEPIPPEDLARRDLSGVDAVLWADAEALGLDAAGARNLEAFVRRGGGFLAYLGEWAQPERINELFHRDRGEGLFPMLLKEGPVVALGEENAASLDLSRPIDHPLFREMTATPELQRIFYSPAIVFFRAVTDAPPESVVARYTTPAQDPAVLEHRLGRGRVLIVTTTPDARGFRLQGSLVPAVLFFEAAHYLVAEDDSDRNVVVGMPVRVPLPPGTVQVVVEPPEEAGGRTEWPIEDASKPFELPAAAFPGFYRFVLK
ncbi:MAG: BatA domain-containing protein, partial [Planctomycetota bacterium]